MTDTQSEVQEPVLDEVLASEIAIEQAHVDAAYAQLELMRTAAARISESFDGMGPGGTHQARVERDAAMHTTLRRLAALDIGQSPLCFGRIDRDDFEQFHVGRIGIEDASHQPLIVDWRAPVAEPFYRATAREPMGVARRRHFQANGRTIVGLDDEVFNEARFEAGVQSGTVVGEGALLRSLSRDRTGRMHDIVATIQAEQDEAIRADRRGILLVTGGPGTGKTAVALHRAAYLLYTHRRQLAGNGVLVVGPSSVFLRYIDQVLPSLGEDQVQLSTVDGLRGDIRCGQEDAVTARCKGSAAMVQFIRNAVRSRQRVLRKPISFIIDGHRIVISVQASRNLIERTQHRRGTHNARRSYFMRLLIDALVGRYCRSVLQAHRRADLAGVADFAPPDVKAALVAGRPLPEDFEEELRDRLRRLPEVREAALRMWPILTGAELVHDLFRFRAFVAEAGEGILSPTEIDLLVAKVSVPFDQATWTLSDVPLIDEADAILGPPPIPKVVTAIGDDLIADAASVIGNLGVGGVSAADVARRYHGADQSEGSKRRELRTYGHIIVDEAQDLTPMQWRMLARRCPTGSFTIVGDMGQASRPGAAQNWESMLAHLPRERGVKNVELSINYRTPAETMEYAAQLLPLAAPGVRASTSVRRTDHFPVVTALQEGYGQVSEYVTGMAGGTVAVIAHRRRHEDLAAALSGVGARIGLVDGLESPVGIFTADEIKGLEFDHVVVVDPMEACGTDESGLRLLYVVLTRPTRQLIVMHRGDLPPELHDLSATGTTGALTNF